MAVVATARFKLTVLMGLAGRLDVVERGECYLCTLRDRQQFHGDLNHDAEHTLRPCRKGEKVESWAV